MTVLTYPYLGDAVTVGQPLGCDISGWPYRVECVTHLYGNGAHTEATGTLVFLEPWPLPTPNPSQAERDSHAAALAHARQRAAGIVR